MPQQSLSETGFSLPSLEELLLVLLLRNHNTRVVVLGVTLLGLTAGLIGTFMLLRKRSLMGDAVSHATLPGIAIAFMLTIAAGSDRKILWVLLLGAGFTGLLGAGVVLLLRNTTRLKEDAALGIVLSVFFGLGVAFLGIIQKMNVGSAAGLSGFIYGKTASMVTADAALIAIAAGLILFFCIILYKEFSLLCFDQSFARTQGFPVIFLDTFMMILVTAVTVIGMQAVGLILMIALLIIPAAAARFWTDRLALMMLASGLIGAVSGYLGAAMSALQPNLPAGAVIVLVASAVFGVSLLVGTRRGLIPRWLASRNLERKVALQHLLRELYELGEDAGGDWRKGATLEALLDERAWDRGQLNTVIARAERAGLAALANSRLRLTEKGLQEARMVVRNHRLWEMYLLEFADVATSKVDRDADRVEHILGQEIVEQLEAKLDRRLQLDAAGDLPSNPHALAGTA